MTTVRRKASARRRDAPGTSVLAVSVDAADAGAMVYRLTMPGRSDVYWLRTRTSSENGEQLVAAGIDGTTQPTTFDAVELGMLRALVAELSLAALVKPGSLLRESIARTAWIACSNLHLALLFDRGTQRQYYAKKRQARAAAKAVHAAVASRIEVARLEYIGSPTLQAMKVAAAAEELSKRWQLGFDTVRKKISAWRREAGITRHT